MFTAGAQSQPMSAFAFRVLEKDLGVSRLNKDWPGEVGRNLFNRIFLSTKNVI